jgi:acetyltransferase-like isoleucine patch superfamily enzyme
VATELWSVLRRFLGACKRHILLQRPWGLQRLGKRSVVKRPRKLIGRKSIQIGDDTYILSKSLILAVSRYAGKMYHSSVRIGNGVYIGGHVYLTAMQEISIGDGCVLSEHVYITDLNHSFDPTRGPIMSQDLVTKGAVRIGANCFLGYRSAVMPGVTLGEWCIVGANSVVTRSFPAYSMIAGAPAQLIKVYSHELGKWVDPGKIEN